MGFIFDFHKKNVINPITFNPLLDKTFHVPIILNSNHNKNNINEFLLFDLEVDSIIGSINKTHTYIPNIREWAAIYVKLPFQQEQLFDNKNITLYKNKKSHAENIKLFCDLYKSLNCPTLIAHNGCKFDFLILIANIYRYLHDTSIVDNLQFFDSYKYIQSKIKYGYYKSLKNRDLFLEYIEHYKSKENLVYKEHNALEDCQMMGLWLFYLL